MLGLKGHAKYEEIKEVALHLQEKTIFIPDEDGFITTNWVASQRYKEGEGVLKLSFSPYLKPYLLQLKTQFTSYKLSNILSLGSGYSIRLYELMKKWQHLGQWEYPVEELKLKFGIEEGMYSRYTHFKNRVLKKAVEEVNEKTDLHIRFNEIKQGRKVEKISFTIQHSVEKEIQIPNSKSDSKEPKALSKEEEMRTRLNTLADGYQFDAAFFAQLHQGASLIWKEDTERELELLIRYVNEEKSVENPLGFIKSKLKTAWEVHQDGVAYTFADLKPAKARTAGRTEVLPDWFTAKEEAQDTGAPNPELAKEKEQVLAKLAQKKAIKLKR